MICSDPHCPRSTACNRPGCPFTPALPVPRGYSVGPCPLCRGDGYLLTQHGPRECPTCRGAGTMATTWLTEAHGADYRARQLGLAS